MKSQREWDAMIKEGEKLLSRSTQGRWTLYADDDDGIDGIYAHALDGRDILIVSTCEENHAPFKDDARLIQWMQNNAWDMICGLRRMQEEQAPAENIWEKGNPVSEKYSPLIEGKIHDLLYLTASDELAELRIREIIELARSGK